MSRSTFFTLLVSVLLQTTTAIYNLTDEFSGDSFFNGWDFFTATDPTGGHVLYQSQVDARAKGLISIQSNSTLNSTKQIFIGVDSTSQTPKGRPSVRITTQKTFQHALVLADIAHQPGGICGVWPAFWMVGANWPANGEIDIVEGVSVQATNQMTLHTNSGPIISQKVDFTGNLLTSNCDINAPNQPTNAGCGIADDSNITFGADFNDIGGGVYATEWTSNFIKIWFFPRNKIPSDIKKGKPTPGAAWGTPNSLFQGAFNMDDHFKNLQIVMNTAFCGDWAGEVWSQTPECAALAPTCNEYVTNNPKAFEQAYWLVNYVKIFQDDGLAAVPSSSSLSSSPGPSQPATSTRKPTVTPIANTPPAVTPPLVATVTKTLTIITTATVRPKPQFNTTDGRPGQRTPPGKAGDGEMGRPDMIFGSPGVNEDNEKREVKRRPGGAVLPLRFLK